MTEQTVSLPTLDEVERIYLLHILQITGSREASAKVLGITKATLYNKIRKHKIPDKRKPGRKSAPLKVNARNTGKVPPSLLNRENTIDVSFSVTPEERDYYYNLDFLCGVYKNLRTHRLEPDPAIE